MLCSCIILQRIAQRWVHAPSGRTYSYDFHPPKVHGVDDATGEALVQRPDDTPEAVTQRLQKYQQMINPLLDFYDKLGLLQVFTGSESNKIYPDVKKYCINELKLKPLKYYAE
jgi:adenylate kinase family enzyme